MDKEAKLFMGFILGEICRLQNKQGMVTVSDATIYGLLNGFEQVTDEFLEKVAGIPESKVTAAAKILQPYFDDNEKELSGYYQIQNELGAAGITREEAIRISTYFHARGDFVGVLEKMDTTGSPIECRKFEMGRDEL